MRTLAPRQSGENLYETARCYSLIARQIVRGRHRDQLSAAERTAHADAVRKALEAFSAAAGAGFSDGPRLLEGPELDTIRLEPRYQQFIESFEDSANPGRAATSHQPPTTA
jgi:hypothetical protein